MTTTPDDEDLPNFAAIMDYPKSMTAKALNASVRPTNATTHVHEAHSTVWVQMRNPKWLDDDHTVVNSALKIGDIWVDMDYAAYPGWEAWSGTAPFTRVFDGIDWRIMASSVTVSNTAPSNPGNGDLWVDTSTPTWTAPSLGNNWVDYGSPYAPAGYYKDANGIVHLRGCIRSGTGAVAAFTLPTGYRPTAGRLQIIVSAYPAFAYLQVTTAGAVQVAAYYGTGTNAEVVLDNIHFATF